MPILLNDLRLFILKFSLAGSLTHACALKTTLKMNSELETLNFLQGLQHLNGVLMDPMWNNYDKLFTYLSQSLSQNPNMWYLRNC